MDQGCEGPPTALTDERCAHTIGLERIDEQGAGLSPGLQRLIIRRAARSDLICGLTLAATLVMAMALVVWQRHPVPLRPAPAAMSPALIVIPPVTIAEPEKRPPVQVRNPFDATEVFEFPAGTSETEAREATAELLLERARDRRG